MASLALSVSGTGEGRRGKWGITTREIDSGIQRSKHRMEVQSINRVVRMDFGGYIKRVKQTLAHHKINSFNRCCNVGRVMIVIDRQEQKNNSRLFFLFLFLFQETTTTVCTTRTTVS